jgi:hypothetical protein
VLGEEVGAAFGAIHLANGVELRAQDQVIGFEGTERVEAARTADGARVPCGDVANQLHPLFGRVRVEHYNNGEKQGRTAARSMLGFTDPYDLPA